MSGFGWSAWNGRAPPNDVMSLSPYNPRGLIEFSLADVGPCSLFTGGARHRDSDEDGDGCSFSTILIEGDARTESAAVVVQLGCGEQR